MLMNTQEYLSIIENIKSEITAAQYREMCIRDRELLGRLIQSDQEKLEVEKERLEQAECILRSKQEALATAQTNNEFIDRLLYLQKERAELATRGQKIKDATDLLDRQKTATREVHPVYLAWKSKADAVIYTEKEIENKQQSLLAAEKTAKEAAEQSALAEEKRGRAEELQKKIDKINAEEQKYQQREQLKEKVAELTNDQKILAEKETSYDTAEKKLEETIPVSYTHLDVYKRQGDVHVKKYLKLLGIQQQKRRAAAGYVVIHGDVQQEIPKGTRLFAGDISFETAEEWKGSENRF